MDYLNQLLLSTLGLEKAFEFNPLDLEDDRAFISHIERFLKKQKVKKQRIDVLNYIKDELQKCVSLFHDNNDVHRYENTKKVIHWIQLESDLTGIKSTKSQISMPRVWAYVYYYLIQAGTFPNPKIKEDFYKDISSAKTLVTDNFKKEHLNIWNAKTGEGYRTFPDHYKDLAYALNTKELIQHPKACKMAKSDLEKMKKNK